MLRSRLPDVVRAMLYRPEFFGKRFGALTQQLLRGPSQWSVGQRELFAAYTSLLNRCHFWAIASSTGDGLPSTMRTVRWPLS